MRRIQPISIGRDPEEERKRTRESVISNFIMFGLIVAVIRTVPFLMRHISE